ncbi:DUF3466 family protein [Salinimonas chungwhensis]|uniref:DUF3466 family protein n=1 Tax=Salinimonas chungwhensis TaxID=265425 RepID=UPI00036F2FF0|nr:DUF3466 family protein [Salinimonas chungwhensis]
MKLKQLAAAMLMATGSVSALAATYDVTPLPVTDIAKSNFGKSIDNTGAMLTAVSQEFNPRIDLALLEESGFFNVVTTLENPEDAQNGVFTSVDYQIIVNFLLNNQNQASIVYPSLASFRSYVTDTVDAELVPGLDRLIDSGEGFTQSAESIARDSISRDFIVGSSELPFERVEYTDEDGETAYALISEGLEQAYAQVNGQTVRLPSPDDLLNGYATAFAVNESFQVAGFGTTDFTDAIREDIEECSDDELRGDTPIELCLKNIVYQRRSNGNSVSLVYPLKVASQIRPVIWSLNASGDIVDITSYPLVYEPEGEQLDSYNYGRAYDINNNGIAVGISATDENTILSRLGANRTRERGEVAAVFSNGETTELLNREENLQSRAISINDTNWITGYVTREPNSVARNFLFAHNLDTEETLYPQGFFENAQTEPAAINNNNIVVGASQFEAVASGVTPKTHAFMYKIGDDAIVDLNNLTSCDSEYLLVDALDINDNNEIIANALIRRPSQFVDGEDILEDGEPAFEDRIVAVKLTPNPNGEIETCDEDDIGNVEDEKYERSGASFSFSALLALFGFAGFRRLTRR